VIAPETLGMEADALHPEADELLPLAPLDRETFERDEYPEPIVEGLIHRGNATNFVGASKSGKSVNALQRAACAAAGLPFLGLAVRRSRVLYVSLEMIAAVLRERMRNIAASTGIPMPEVGSDSFQVIGGAPGLGVRVPTVDLTTDRGATQVRRTIEKLDSEYVLIDTLYNALPGADINDNAAMGLAFRRVRAIAQDTGAAIELLDHTGKGERSGPTSHAAIGASVKGGAVATIVELRRTRTADGWLWEMHVDGWYEPPEEAIAYRQPKLPDGSLGYGCERVTAAQARGLSREVVRALFHERGELDERGRRYFASKRKLQEAAQASGLCGSSSTDAAEALVHALLRDFAAPETASGARAQERPLVTRRDGSASNSPQRITWRERDTGTVR